MRKALVLFGIVAALVIPTVAIAVDINPSHIGSSCSDGGTYHFVANRLTGASLLTVTFTGGVSLTDEAPDKTTRGTSHWYVDSFGSLASASATNAGGLVLSGFECWEKDDK